MKKKLKIGEALALLKSKKSRLSQLQDQRLNSFYVSEGKKAHFKYADLTKEIKAESKDILSLKMAITRANMDNNIVGGDIPIQEAIFRVGEFRSALSNLEAIVKAEESARSFRFSDDKEVVRNPQVKLKEIDATVKELAEKKGLLDTRIQDSNWRYTVEVELSSSPR
jgi:hypothetical protein